MKLDGGSCVWAFALLSLCAAGCGEGGEASDISTDAANGEVGSEVYEVSPLEPTEEVVSVHEVLEEPYDDDECHYDCPGGYYCEYGTMMYMGSGPAPCDYRWGPLGACMSVDESEPCVSGVCGEVEFCQDDMDFLESLVPESGTWREVSWAIGHLEEDGISYTTPSLGTWSERPCIWRFQQKEVLGSPVVFEMRTMAFGGVEPSDVAGTTNVMIGELPQEALAGVWLDGVAIEPSLVKFYWIPGGAGDFYGDPGLSSAVVINGTDGAVTTVAWLVQPGGKLRLGIHTSPAEATPTE